MNINILVKPGSKKGSLVEVTPSGDYVVYVREKAHDGEANVGVVKLLAEYFGVAKSCVIVRAGAKSRKKIVEIIK